MMAFANSFLTCVVAAVFSLLMTNATLAQGPPAGAGMPAIPNPKLESREREIREGRLRSAELDASAENKEKRRIEANIVQVKEDFARIQIVRNQIAHNLVARVPLDYHLISDQTEEINKRSNRLKTFMISHPADDKGKEQDKAAEFESGDMTSALVRLCKLIDGFVENPALKNAATIDAQQLEKAKIDKARADTDLLSIVELSSRIQKSAERLSKTP